MTELTRIHEILIGLEDGVVSCRPHVSLVQIFRLVIDQLTPHLDISTIGIIARTCKSLSVMTSDVTFLDYLLRLIPSSNSEQTRRRFLIPRTAPICRISRGLYSQSDSLHLAIQKYGGMNEFRYAVEKRRIMTIKRRNQKRERLLQATIARMRRSIMVTDAMEVLGLPADTHLLYPPAILFINNIPPIPMILAEIRLARIVETVCWLFYLRNYTDFYEACETRREIMGDYPGLTRDVSDDYEKPLKWPWL